MGGYERRRTTQRKRRRVQTIPSASPIISSAKVLQRSRFQFRRYLYRREGETKTRNNRKSANMANCRHQSPHYAGCKTDRQSPLEFNNTSRTSSFRVSMSNSPAILSYINSRGLE